MRRGRLLLIIGSTSFVAAILLRLGMFEGPYAPPEALRPAPIIDIHCHAAGLGAKGSGAFASKAMQENFRFSIYLDAFGVTEEELRNKGDSIVFERLHNRLSSSKHVRGAIVLAMDGAVDNQGELDRKTTEFYLPNDFVAEQTSRFDTLHFGASINPLRNDALERLERVHEQGALLIKWLPSVQMFDPADPRIIPFYQRLAELNLPLLTHAGQERSFTHAKDAWADPKRLKNALEAGVRVIVAHAASTGENEGEEDMDRLIGMLTRYPNLFADISSMTQINKLGYLKKALQEPQFEGRLLYGSDFPLINTPLTSAWYFPDALSFSQIQRISSKENPWDQDVELKRALGVPARVFADPAVFLGLQPPPK